MITTEQRRDQFKCKKFSSKIICGETNKETKLDIMKKKNSYAVWNKESRESVSITPLPGVSFLNKIWGNCSYSSLINYYLLHTCIHTYIYTFLVYDNSDKIESTQTQTQTSLRSHLTISEAAGRGDKEN